jgi:putative MATE family efflux protein
MNYTYRQIWLINYPVMLSILMEQLINITDAVFLGHVGEVELGASALGSIYYLAIYMLGFGFSLGVQVMVGQYNGKGHYTGTGRTFFQGLVFLCVLAILLSLSSYFFSPFLLRYFVHSSEIYCAVIDYLDWRCFGLLFSFPFLAFRSFYIGIVRTNALSWAALAVLINIPCNYWFVFVLDRGIAGAAIASSLSEAASLLIVMIYTWLIIDRTEFGLKFIFDKCLLVELWHLSVWSMLHAFISVAPWFLFFVVIERLGEAQLAVSNIIRSVSTIFFVIVNSFAATTGALVSNLIGAGERQYLFPLCRKILKLGYAIGLPLIVLAMVFRRQITGFYTDSSQLINISSIPFAVMLLNYMFALPGYVYINAVTGTGKTRIAFWFQLITIIIYLFYLYLLSHYTASLAVYLTAEYLFVILLAVQSVLYLRISS